MVTPAKKSNGAGKSPTMPKTAKAAVTVGMSPVVPKVGGSVTHTIRKIKNGFIHSHSMHDGKGNFDSEEVYSPKADMMGVVPPPKSSSPQRGAGTQKSDGKQKMNTPQRENKPMKLSAASRKGGATDVPGKG